MSDERASAEHVPTPAPRDTVDSHSPEPQGSAPVSSVDVAVYPSPDPRREDPAWHGWDVVTAMGMFVVGFILASLGLGIYIHFRHLDVTQIRDARLILPLQLFLYLVVVGTMYFIIHGLYGRPFWQAIRWNWPRNRWIPFIPIGIVLAFTTELVQAKLPTPKNMPIEEFFRTPSAAYIMGFLAVACAPAVEELFFRGFLYPVLARAIGVTSGVAVTALFFAVIHASQVGWAWSSILLLFVVGLVLTTVRARTRSVAASFLIHTAYNGTIFVLLFFATDHFHHLEKMGAAILH